MTDQPEAFDDALAAAGDIQGKPDVTPGVEDLGKKVTSRPSTDIEVYEPQTNEGDRRTAKIFGRVAVDAVEDHVGGEYTSTAKDAAADFAEVMLELGRMTGKGLFFRGILSAAALGLVFVPALIGALRKFKGDDDAE